jgi:ketosteroid isomerase-like protein
VRDTAAAMEDRRIASIRQGMDAFNRGDVDALLGFCHEDIEIDDPERTGRTWRGHDEYREFIGEWLELFDDYAIEVEEIEANGDSYYVRFIQRGRGRGSGLEFELPLHYVLTFRGERIARMQLFTPAADARRAAGLSD